MRKLLSGLFATGLALATAITGVMPAQAAPRASAPAPIVAPGDAGIAQDVQWNRRDARRYREMRRAERRFDRRADRYERRRDGYYRGYRGYRDRRAGYRYHNGYWFPAAAFLAGALATGAIVDANRNRASAGGSHVQWCANRYRSYRASDNTFQPYNGPRQQCRSPY